MNDFPKASGALEVPSRRRFLGGAGKATLSATAVALIVGCESMAANMDRQAAVDPQQDVSILNVALGLEHEAIGAYQLGAESGLLQKPVLQTAVLFQSQHEEHRDALAGAIGKLGRRSARSEVGSAAAAVQEPPPPATLVREPLGKGPRVRARARGATGSAARRPVASTAVARRRPRRKRQARQPTGAAETASRPSVPFGSWCNPFLCAPARSGAPPM